MSKDETLTVATHEPLRVRLALTSRTDHSVTTRPAPDCVAPLADLSEGRRLEYLTIAWNVVEAVVSIGAGAMAGSTALIGFGADSVTGPPPVGATMRNVPSPIGSRYLGGDRGQGA